jgi:hypothetical protein
MTATESCFQRSQFGAVACFITSLVAVKWCVDPWLRGDASLDGSPLSPPAAPLLSPHQQNVVWGLFTRAVGGTFLITFAGLRGQISVLIGEDGIHPAAALLQTVWRDLYPFLGPRDDHPSSAHTASRLAAARAALRRARANTLEFGRRMLSSFHAFRLFPTVFWLTGCSDASLRAAMDAGCVVSASIVYGGGSFTPALLLAAWFLFLSVATVSPEVGYPWDCLLLEVGLATAVSMLAPLPLHAKLSFAAVSAPCAEASLVLRLLLVRVMVGMGKLKFAAGWTQHSLYLKQYMMWQPLPTRLAWWLYVGREETRREEKRRDESAATNMCCNESQPTIRALAVGVGVVWCDVVFGVRLCGA